MARLKSSSRRGDAEPPGPDAARSKPSSRRGDAELPGPNAARSKSLSRRGDAEPLELEPAGRGDVGVDVEGRVLHDVAHAGLRGEVEHMRERHDVEELGEEATVVGVALDNKNQCEASSALRAFFSDGP